MIRYGARIQIMPICPDCQKPMTLLGDAQAYPSLFFEVDSDFSTVQCMQEGCINRYFVTTIEKKSGMVLFTDARYKLSYVDATYEPLYPVYKTAEEMKK